MYNLVGEIDDSVIDELIKIQANAAWKVTLSDTRDYKTWFCDHIPDVYSQFGELHRAFFLNIPPQGKVHKHVDTSTVAKTYHVPVLTNDKACSYQEDIGQHLTVGCIYGIDRGIEHHSVNDGGTDRVHLIIECI